MQLKVKQMWTATKKLADGRITYYAYAWKGGPLIAKGVGATKDDARGDMERILSQPDTLAKLAAARDAQQIKPKPSVNYVEGIVRRFLESPEFNKLAGSTKRDYRGILDQFRTEFGDWPVSLFEDPRIAQDMAGWRDAAGGPRSGDMRMSVVSRLFSWARGRGVTSARPTDAIERIHKADRSDLIWMPEDMARILAVSTEPLQLAMRLAAETGLRQGDLIRLPWSAVSDMAIQVRTSKRGKQVTIPITPPIRALLNDIPRQSPILLTNTKGKPWSSSGLQTAFQRAKKAAAIEGLRWHDFRGTAVTRLAKTKLTLRDIARIIGWSENQVEGILSRYVSADALAIDMLRRMNGEQKTQTNDKPHENREG